jgi:hypothetical protein
VSDDEKALFSASLNEGSQQRINLRFLLFPNYLPFVRNFISRNRNLELYGMIIIDNVFVTMPTHMKSRRFVGNT